MAHDHEKITYGKDELKELFDACVLTGTIVEVDTDNDKADVNISGLGQRNGVPVFYHCEGESTVEGGASAFEEDDNVYVLNKKGKANPGASDLQIVGFVDGLRRCVWEPWGATICENHQWYVSNYNNSYSGLCLDPLPEEFELLEDDDNRILKCDPSHFSVPGDDVARSNIQWGYSFGDEEKIKHCRYMRIKISTFFNTTYDYYPGRKGSVVQVQLNAILDGVATSIALNFEESPFYTHVPNEYKIDDNGGLEQKIDLQSYGLEGSIWAVSFHVVLQYDPDNGGFELDYVTFSN